MSDVSGWLIYTLGLATLPALSGLALLALKVYWEFERWANRRGWFWNWHANGIGDAHERRSSVRTVNIRGPFHWGTYATNRTGSRWAGFGSSKRWNIVVGRIDLGLMLPEPEPRTLAEILDQ